MSMTTQEIEERSRRIAPAGTLGLPKLLDDRRLQYGVIDDAFKVQAAFDRVFVLPLESEQGATYGNTGILMPDTVRARKDAQAARGLLIGAGLLALDALRSNGIDLGHVVTFINNAPFMYEYGYLGGKRRYFLLMRAGDLCGSEDLAASMRDGTVRVGEEDDCHVFVDTGGRVWKPRDPWQGDDY